MCKRLLEDLVNNNIGDLQHVSDEANKLHEQVNIIHVVPSLIEGTTVIYTILLSWVR